MGDKEKKVVGISNLTEAENAANSDFVRHVYQQHTGRSWNAGLVQRYHIDVTP